MEQYGLIKEIEQKILKVHQSRASEGNIVLLILCLDVSVAVCLTEAGRQREVIIYDYSIYWTKTTWQHVSGAVGKRGTW